MDITIGINHAQIPSDEKSIAAQLLRGFLGHVPITFEHIRSADFDLTDVPLGQCLACGAVGDFQLNARQLKSDCAGAALALSAFTPDQRRQMDPGLVACAETGSRFPASALIDALLYRRTKAVIAMAGFFERYDLMITPTMPTGAIPLGADLPPPGFAGQSEWGPLWTDWCPYTPPFNVTQQPAGTVPCGLDGDGLPIGLQIVGWKRQEATVLRAMRAFESERPPARVPMPHRPA